MFFNDLKELEEQYEQGTVPEPGDLSGEYYVVAPWFPWVSLEPLKHRKDVGADGSGDNVVLKDTRFGYFKLETESGALLIDYDQPENNPIMRGVIDRLRKLPDGRIIGKLYYKIFGQEVFLMYFEMKPKEE